ncbi:MAG: M6 family metalloprotease domain-containing protein, partial [Armatimonadetes bacterium]|nr:M6 family metalloprotease domain-containing protein [Armatimonadota bacterium]
WRPSLDHPPARNPRYEASATRTTYYEEVSHGAFRVTSGPAGVVVWATAAQDHDYYGTNDVGGYDVFPGTLVTEAVQAADAVVDFGPYDQDGNGEVDVVNIIHQGTGEENGTFGAATDIWSHSWDLESAAYFGYGGTGAVSVDSGARTVNAYVIQPELLAPGVMSTIGVFCHEYGHALSLPDLYDTDYNDGGLYPSEGVGNWDLMAGGSWNYTTTDGDTPALMSAWCKHALAWVNPSIVTDNVNGQSIPNAENNAFALDLWTDGLAGVGEHFLIENRQQVGFDAGLPASGLCIWHIDDAMTSNDFPWYPGHTTFGHYWVALEQADGQWDMEKAWPLSNRGDTGDLYPGSTTNRTYNAASTPNSRFYDGSDSKIAVTNISDSAATMTADIIVTDGITIGGYVTDSGSGLPIAGVTMNGFGLPTAPVTNAAGYYSASVAVGFSGTIQPVKACYSFAPVSTVYTNVTINLSGENYTGTLKTYTLSGTVTHFDGGALTNVRMNGLPGNPLNQGDGTFSATVNCGSNYTITPALAGFTFAPPSRTYTIDETGNVTGADFVGSPIVRVSGQVTKGSSGPAFAGVTMDFNPDVAGGDPVTNGAGNYTKVVPYHWNGTVTPTLSCYTFTAPSTTYPDVTANQTNQNYYGTIVPYVISGTVVDEAAAPVGAVTIDFSPDPPGGDPVTAGDGTYSATVDCGQTYTVTPVAPDCTSVLPGGRTYTAVNSSSTNQDYQVVVHKFTIHGVIEDEDGGAIVGLTLTGFPSATTTDVNGQYSAVVLCDWSGTVVPVSDDYVFEPTPRTYTNVRADHMNEYYNATRVLDHVTIEAPTSVQVPAGGTHSFSGKAYTKNGVQIPGASLTWSLIGPAVGALSAGGSYTAPTAPGADTVQVEAAYGGATKTATASVTVVPGAPSKLAFLTQPPASATAGAVLAPPVQVRVLDTYGNLVDTATSPVTMVLGQGAGTLGGTRMKNAVAGIAQFADLSVDLAGTGKKLSAFSTGLTSVDSDAFAIVPGPAAKLSFSVQPPASTTAGQTLSSAVKVAIVDALGNVVTTATDQISLALTQGTGTLSGTKTMAAVAGVATFSDLSLDLTGADKKLTATSGPLTAAISNAFAIVAGTPMGLAFSVQPPVSAPAGLALTPAVKVSIVDSLGNVVTGATDAVALAMTAGSGTLSGTKMVNAVAGVATFADLSLDVAGAGKQLTASATGLTSAASDTFAVTVGVPAKLSFAVQPPASTVAGATLSPAVEVAILDAGGNVVTASADNVTLTLSQGTGTLSGTLTVAPANGVASFGDLSLNLVGSDKQVTASATGLTSATSQTFAITAGSATAAAFTAQPPATAGAGTPLTPAVQVSLVDAHGNVVAGATEPVTLTLTQGTGTLGGTLQVSPTNGVATFSDLTLDLVGNDKQLTAAAGALTPATSSVFEIVPGTVHHLSFSVQPPATATSGAALAPAVEVTAWDAHGNVATNSVSAVSVALTQGTGILSGTTTAVAPVNGVAAFADLSVDTAGAGKQLTATSVGVPPVVSDPFEVLVSAAARLSFSVQPPASAVAGQALAPALKVSILDAQRNVVPTGTDLVTMALTQGTGALSGTKSVAAVNGVATFSDLSIDLVGADKQLTASAGILTAAVSSQFAVVAGSPTQLSFTVQPPASTTAGAPLSPAVVVTLLDSQGNVAEGAANLVGMALQGSGTLGGTRQVAAVNGVATFSNLSVDTAGTGKTLVASASGVTPATSSPFAITVGPAVQLVFAVQPPASVLVGAAMAPAVQVAVADAFGNAVPAATDAVSLALTNGSGTLTGTTPVAAVNGVAVFGDLSLNLVGADKQLTASAAGFSSVVSNPFTVVGLPARLSFTVQPPASTAAGATLAPALKVAILDINGYVVTSATGQVSLALSQGTGTLSGTNTVAAVNGVATFSDLSLDLVGANKQLTASSGVLTQALSDTFAIEPGAATHLSFTVQPPVSAAAGVALTPALQVSVLDAQGNVVTSATNQLALSLTQGTGTLSGTKAAAAANGVATFADLSLNLAGADKQLTASTAGLTSAMSSVFAIVAGALAKVEVTPAAATLSAGEGLTFSAKTYDAWGNVRTGDARTWTAVSGQITAGGAYTAPSTTGTDTVTAKSGTTSGTATVTVNAGAVARVEISPAAATVGTKGQQQFSTKAYDAHNNEITGLAFEWSVDGSVGTIVQGTGLFTAATTAGEYVDAIKVAVGGKTDTASVTIEPGPFDHVSVTPNPADVTVGGQQQFGATARDAYENVVPGKTFGWSLTNGGGKVTQAGLFTAGTQAGTFTDTVQATAEGKSGAATVTVSTSGIDHVGIAPDPVRVKVANTNRLVATAYDQYDNPIAGAVFTWSVVNGGGAIDSTGAFTAGTTAGEFANTVRAETGGKSATGTVEVLPGTLHSLAVSPTAANVKAQGTQQFTTTALDQYANEITDATVTWAVVQGGGEIDSAGLFTAGDKLGQYAQTVEAKTGGQQATASVAVVPKDLDHLVLSPDPLLVRLAPGATTAPSTTFTARGYDDLDNEITGLTVTWNLVNGGGSLDAAGLFAPTTVPGVYEGTVKAAAEGKSAVATVAVEYKFTLAPGLQLAAMPGTGPVDAKEFFGTEKTARWNPATQTWELYALGAFDCAVGQGYAVRLDQATELGVSSLAKSPLAVAVPGVPWNLFANPYTQPLSWDLATVRYSVNGGPSQPLSSLVGDLSRPVDFSAWLWDPAVTGWELLCDPTLLPGSRPSMNTGEAAWLRAYQPGVVLSLPGSNVTRAAAPAVRARSHGDTDWAVKLVADVAGAGSTPAWMGESSRFGRSGLQLAGPPPLDTSAPFVSLDLKPGGADHSPVAADLRSPNADRQEWQLAVQTNATGRDVRLTWPDLSELPDSARLRLVDLLTGESTAMRSVTSHTFRSDGRSATQRLFRIEQYPAQEGGLRLSSVSVSPGRAGAGVTVSFVLSDEADVQICVRSGSGRVVTVSPLKHTRAGAGFVTWSGRAVDDRPAPRGIYLFELTARDAEGQATKAVRTAPIR